jgi:hypothetical protein
MVSADDPTDQIGGYAVDIPELDYLVIIPFDILMAVGVECPMGSR